MLGWIILALIILYIIGSIEEKGSKMSIGEAFGGFIGIIVVVAIFIGLISML